MARGPAQFFPHPTNGLLQRLALLLALVAASAGAQPAPRGERIVRAWAEGQRASEKSVLFRERVERTVEGPGQHHRMYVESVVDARPDGVRRRVVYAETDNGPIAPERLARMEQRMERSLGPGSWWSRPPTLPTLLSDPRARGEARAMEHEGTPAWEVEMAPAHTRRPAAGFDRGTLWFERRPGALRLLAARFERRLPAGGHAALDATFTRIAGMDLPLRHSAEVVVRQRRRLRWFTTLVRTDVEYSNWEIARQR